MSQFNDPTQNETTPKSMRGFSEGKPLKTVIMLRQHTIGVL
jgi:hypothetical protein